MNNSVKITNPRFEIVVAEYFYLRKITLKSVVSGKKDGVVYVFFNYHRSTRGVVVARSRERAKDLILKKHPGVEFFR